MTRIALILSAALFAGCGTWEEHELTVIAEACVEEDSVRVTFEGCRSSSCSRVVDQGCSANLDGDVLTVRGGALVETWQGQGACTLDCRFTQAWCALPTGVDLQRTRLAFGTDPGSLTLAEARCFDHGWAGEP